MFRVRDGLGWAEKWTSVSPCQQHLRAEEARRGGSEQALLRAVDQQLEQITAAHVFHDEVQEAGVLEAGAYTRPRISST